VLVSTGAGSFTPIVRSVPARPGRVAGSCDPATAPSIRAAVTQFANTELCAASGGWQYWTTRLRIGDTVTVALNTLPLIGGFSVELTGPDQDFAGSTPLCAARPAGGHARLICLIPASGRYAIALHGVSTAMTPTVRRPRAQPGRVAGACSIARAPRVRVGITQFAHTKLCSDTGEHQFWKLRLARGDRLRLQVHAQASGGDGTLGLYPPDTATVSGRPVCSLRFPAVGATATTFTCRITRAGTYPLAFHGVSGSFTPRVVHPRRRVAR
jgi:hypothetical protein